MKAAMCETCQHSNSMYGLMICDKGHKPRFYLPRNGNPYDMWAGWKRKCNDFKKKEDGK